MLPKAYPVLPVERTLELQGAWGGSPWRQAPGLEISHFRPESSAHRPRTQAKLLYSPDDIHGIFRVHDWYVRSVRTKFQEPVYKDSCVEFFVQPKAQGGYFNFEFNCGGALLASYVTDPTREPGGGLKASVPLAPEDDRLIRRFRSLPEVVDPEISAPVTWYLEFAIPFAVLEKYAGPLRPVAGRIWRANFHKCADETSHPHWAAWSPVPELNFHSPESFGMIEFE